MAQYCSAENANRAGYECPLSGVLRALGSSSVSYANKIGYFLDYLLPRKRRWEAHGKQPDDWRLARHCRRLRGVFWHTSFILGFVGGIAP